MTIVEFLKARLDEDEAEVSMGDFNGSDIGARAAERLDADIAAKRAIVDQLRLIEAGVLIVGTNHPEYRSALGFAVRALASVYSDHPGYRPEWRP